MFPFRPKKLKSDQAEIAVPIADGTLHLQEFAILAGVDAARLWRTGWNPLSRALFERRAESVRSLDGVCRRALAGRRDGELVDFRKEDSAAGNRGHRQHGEEPNPRIPAVEISRCQSADRERQALSEFLA